MSCSRHPRIRSRDAYHTSSTTEIIAPAVATDMSPTYLGLFNLKSNRVEAMWDLTIEFSAQHILDRQLRIPPPPRILSQMMISGRPPFSQSKDLLMSIAKSRAEPAKSPANPSE